jgi:hypothetical protein
MNKLVKLEQRVTRLEQRVRGGGAIDSAKEWLLDYLSHKKTFNGVRCELTHILFMDARRDGISQATLRQARLELKDRIVVERQPATRYWRWRRVR